MSTERQVILTDDGSATIATAAGVTYHSRYGAVQESEHVYTKSGLEYYLSSHPNTKEVSIFEMGFGTGLNALLSWEYLDKPGINLYYEAIELFPLKPEETDQLNYTTNEDLFTVIHKDEWGTAYDAAKGLGFTLLKLKEDLVSYQPKRLFDIIYFDAFAPEKQPELWTPAIFQKMYAILKEGGVLTTYCSKGDVRRAMLSAGFKVEKLDGPKGKREILRAIK